MKSSGNVLLIMIAGWVLSAGCTSSTESQNVASAGLRANISVFARGDGRTEVSTFIFVGDAGLSATSVELTGGDTLTATANGVTIPLHVDELITGDFVYESSFNFDDPEMLVRVSLNRPNHTSAPNSTVTVPAGFELTLPIDGSEFRFDDRLDVTWTPSGTGVGLRLSFQFDCKSEDGSDNFLFRGDTVQDTGISSYILRTLMDSNTVDTRQSCDLEISLYRERSGTLDPGWGEGGTIEATTIRDLEVKILPDM